MQRLIGSHRQAVPFAAALLALAQACGAGEVAESTTRSPPQGAKDSLEAPEPGSVDDESGVIQARSNFARIARGRSALDDRHAPAAPDSTTLRGEYELMSGRLSRVPVSKPFETTIRVEGPHHLRLMNWWCTEDDDTGMLVSFQYDGQWRTMVNDDHEEAGGNGKCSYIDLGARSGTTEYAVTVFSMRRETARLLLYKDEGKGAGWEVVERGVGVGGTLVKLGALHNGEFIEVESRENATGSRGTFLRLFQVSGFYRDDGTDFTYQQQPLFSDSQAGDIDPRIDINEAKWTFNPSTYVLVGKDSNAGTENGDVETWVDLVRGPEGPHGRYYADTGVYLTRGRHQLYLYARLANPVGHFTDDTRTHNPPGFMTPMADNDDDTGGCPSAAAGHFDDEELWYRGQHNQRAFQMVVHKSSDGQLWQLAGPARTVTRGAFGNTGFQRFVMDVAVSESGYYRLWATPLVSDVEIESTDGRQAFYRVRNPNMAELKVATSNLYFYDTAFDEERTRNAANLLAARGTVQVSDKSVIDRETQGPFEWDTDVFGLQELIKRRTDNGPDVHYAEILRDEAETRGSQRWAYAIGRGETWGLDGVRDGPGMNALFVRDHLWPGSDEASAYFSEAAMQDGPNGGGGCDVVSYDGSLREPGAYIECYLNDDDNGIFPWRGDINNYAVPVKAKVFLGDDDNGEPVTIVNVHLESSDGASDFMARRNELWDLVATIKDLLAAEPTAFNSDGNPDPLAPGNRIIILGDYNIRSHECGEHYWFVRELREQFGWAVDAAMAMPDLNGGATLGMHTSDAGYYWANGFGYPIGFQYFFWTNNDLVPAWVQEDPRNYTTQSRYRGLYNDHRRDALAPWWASTGRTKDPGIASTGERYDVIMLVGKGWANDDAVLNYQVMVDRNKNDGNRHSLLENSGRAVEMWAQCNDDAVFDSDEAGYEAGKSYQPNHNVGCGTQPGDAALNTDHRPVGARLRIWR